MMIWTFNEVNFKTVKTRIIDVFLNNKINSLQQDVQIYTSEKFYQCQSFPFKPSDNKEKDLFACRLFRAFRNIANGRNNPQIKKKGRATPKAQPRWVLVQHSTLGLVAIKYFGFSESDKFWHLNISKHVRIILGWTTKEIIRNRFAASFHNISRFLNLDKVFSSVIRIQIMKGWKNVMNNLIR